jgi:hypothetical protein
LIHGVGEFAAGLLEPAEPGELHLAETRFAQENLVRGRDDGEAGAFLLLHFPEHRFREQSEIVVQHHRASRHQESMKEGNAETVMKGQNHHDAIRRRQAEVGNNVTRVALDVAVGDHYPLWLAGRARGEHQGCKVGLRGGEMGDRSLSFGEKPLPLRLGQQSYASLGSPKPQAIPEAPGNEDVLNPSFGDNILGGLLCDLCLKRNGYAAG